MARQAKEDELVDSRIRSVDSSVSMDDKSDMKKKSFLASEKPLNSFKGYTYYYSVLLIIVCIVVLNGCSAIPSTIEVAATLSKKAYKNCNTLDNWQCLWDNESSR
jgi:hypothetical protein